MQRFVKFLLSNYVPVNTWENKETADLRAKAYFRQGVQSRD